MQGKDFVLRGVQKLYSSGEHLSFPVRVRTYLKSSQVAPRTHLGIKEKQVSHKTCFFCFST